MEAKKIVIVLIIIIALGSGAYLFQKNKQDKVLVAHSKLKFQQLAVAAKQSSAAGLLVMASAINKYKQVKGHYPDALIDLYPDFISDKPFISTLNWKYSLKNGSYLIKKNIKGQKTFASIGPEFRLKTGIITSATQLKTLADSKSKFKKITTVKVVALKNSTNGSDIKEHIKLSQTGENISSPNTNALLRDKKKEIENKNSQLVPSIRIVKKPLNKDENFLLSLNGDRLYIWKTKNGIIGFSDIQYPTTKQLTIYRNQGWIEYVVN
jgi:hypothetical protein